MKRALQPYYILVGGLFVAGLAARLYAAWCVRHNLNLDAGVVALMAKHIAEGRALPTFFYGQAHMGSLEALFSGFFCWVFGVSGFAVCLGTVFVSVWLLPIVYLWAKQAAGRTAGAVALAFTVVGPSGFFHYNATPRGAYAAALTLGAFLLWYATCMAVRFARDGEQRVRDFLILGIAAGLAWWSSQLTTAAIISAALLLLIVLQRAAFTWRILIGALGFFIGSAPFWRYNLLHDWPSFAFADTFGRVAFSDAVIWFFTDRFTSLMLPYTDWPYVRAVTLVLYVVIVILGLALLVYGWSKPTRRQDPRSITLLGLVLFTLLFAAIYATSHFAAIATPRYFLPMVAPIAVLLGVVTQWLTGIGIPRWLAIVPTLFLIAGQYPALPWARHFEAEATQRQHRLEKLGEALETIEERVFYAPVNLRAWNFALRERFVFVDLFPDFYRPHMQRAETSDRIGLVNGYGGLESFRQTSGGQFSELGTPGVSIQHGFTPPTDGYERVTADQIRSIVNQDGIDIKAALTDQQADTYWLSELTAGTETLTIEFKEPTEVNGFRFVASHPRGYPFEWSVYGVDENGQRHTFHENEIYTRFFWSGPRPYWGPPFERMEVRFPAHRLQTLEIENHITRPDFRITVFGLDVFAPAPAPDPSGEAALDALIDALRENGIRHLYADRWEANAVARETGHRILTTLRAEAFPATVRLDPASVRVDRYTAILVRSPEAPRLRRMLARRGAHYRETEIGPWRLFYGWSHENPQDLALLWSGFNAFSNRGQAALLAWQDAQERIASGQHDQETIAMLQESVELNPYLAGARHDLLHEATRQGDTALQQATTEALDQWYYPQIEAPIRFTPDIALAGLSVNQSVLQPGDMLRMTTFWDLDPQADTARFAVFIHFLHERRILFQDDHILVGDIPKTLRVTQTGTSRFPVEREILVPTHLPPGPITVRVGLVERRTGDRIRPRTSLPERRRAVYLPLQFNSED